MSSRKSFKPERQKQNNTAELYFLIQKFLSCGPLKKTQEVMMQEIEENKIFQKRLDWKGDKHDRLFDDMEHQYSHIRPDYLLQICEAFGNTCSAGISKNEISLLTYKPLKLVNSDYNFKQLYNYIARFHGAPVRNKHCDANIVNILRGREVSGLIPRSLSIMPKMYSSLQIQRRTIGHLSAVYCLLFDATGRYILTGADDLLIKLWSAHNGRLLASFRGASYEISDIAVNVENTLLAAGSLDRILRVWNLQTGVPVAVLLGHTGMITSVNFCPSACWNVRYLISTSTDGAVAFWTYTCDSNDKVNFKLNPTVYQEKIRPGQAQMICSSFSPGGSFLATGSADHNVRVYYMKGDEGPQRILETELHTDRVDSIQWAHSGIRFLSGSKDGSAIIWYFEGQHWKHVYLHMGTKLANFQPTEEVKKLKVTMVSWDITDEWVVTAASDFTLKIWRAHTGQLERVLTGHTNEVYVLESHPMDRHVMLSAGHDGQVFIWDIFKGQIIARYINTIEGQGFGQIHDGKWSPDGCMIALSDSHGRIITFGFGSGDSTLHQLPMELFFHTDYRPLARDASQYVLDEQTQVPPHLMAPPFLVDIDGNPYPAVLQRLVPGREHCNAEQLIPNIVMVNEGRQEVVQGMSEEHSYHEPERIHPQSYDMNGEGGRNGFRTSARRSRDEGIRQITGDWQSDPNMKWSRPSLVRPLHHSELRQLRKYIECLAEAEVEEYHRQMRQRPHMINTTGLNTARLNVKKVKERPVKKTIEYLSDQTESSEEENNSYSDSSVYSDWIADEGVVLEPPKRSKRRQVKHKIVYDTDEEQEDEEVNVESDGEEDDDKLQEPAPPKQVVARPKKTQEVPEKFKPSEWLAETKPRKSPYFPQMGDELVYFVQGHQLYMETVKSRNIYTFNAKDLPWNKVKLKEFIFVKIIGIRYEIKPPRLCCLKLAIIDEEGKPTGNSLTVKYHDMPDVLDFLVLKQTYETAMSRQWVPGDRFRCMIDDGWWFGEILSSSDEYLNSPFLCHEVKWDNGEQERMSPWDLEIIDESRVPSDPSVPVPVLEKELHSILYKPTCEDWPNVDRYVARENILEGLSKIMELAIAEAFIVPVDLSIYSTYAYVIEYPMDLSTIRSRFEYFFYRRITAAQFDIRYLASNTEKYNERHSNIVKHARILTELCLKVVRECASAIDISETYRHYQDSYVSSEDETNLDVDVDVESTNEPSTSRIARAPHKALCKPEDWKIEATNILYQLFASEDSMPFQQPVSHLSYPDYNKVIQNPMDLTTVRAKLEKGIYKTPHDFVNDMTLIFKNSRIYNTNPKSLICVMTERLSKKFENSMNLVIRSYAMARKGLTLPIDMRPAGSSTSMDNSVLNFKTRRYRRNMVAVEDDDDDCSSEHEKERSNIPNIATKTMSSSSEEDSDNQPLTCLLNNNSTASTSKSRSHSQSSESEISLTRLKDLRTCDVRPISYDSDDSFKLPNRKTVTDSSNEESMTSKTTDSDDRPVAHSRPKSRRRKKYAKEDSEPDASSGEDEVNTRSRRRIVVKESTSDSETEQQISKRHKNNGSQKKGFLTTVSSRGRIRKLTPRIQALMRK